MKDIETLIIEAAHKRDLTFAKNFNGRPYALMDADWIGYFDTLDEVLEFLGISVEIDEDRKQGMAREEAVLVLDHARPQTAEIDRQFYDDEDLNNALDMGIEAIKQEPCEDAISREAILLEIDKIKDNYGGLLDVAMFIRGLPPVNPQPKTGHWIDTDNYYQRWKCSECGCHTRDAVPPFCPNCGARMVEPQESEDKK